MSHSNMALRVPHSNRGLRQAPCIPVYRGRVRKATGRQAEARRTVDRREAALRALAHRDAVPTATAHPVMARKAMPRIVDRRAMTRRRPDRREITLEERALMGTGRRGTQGGMGLESLLLPHQEYRVSRRPARRMTVGAASKGGMAERITGTYLPSRTLAIKAPFLRWSHSLLQVW